MSPNFPRDYDNNGECRAVMLRDAVLSAKDFATGSFDRLSINGTIFSGSAGPQDFVVVAGMEIEWSSDLSFTQQGWRICHEETLGFLGPTTAPVFLGSTTTPVLLGPTTTASPMNNGDGESMRWEVRSHGSSFF